MLNKLNLIVNKIATLPTTAKVAMFIVLLIIIGLVTGLILGVWNTTPVTKPEIIDPNDKVISYSVEIPDETLPDEDYVWYGRHSDPKSISLPSINTKGFVMKVTVDQNVQIAVPDNIHFAGWFVDSVRPGDTGLSIIDGHIDGPSIGGIFKDLGNLKPADEFTIEMGDGSLRKFRVKEVITVDTNDAAPILYSQYADVKSQLNLISCAGIFLADEGTYDKRIIVTSEYLP